MLAFKDSPNFEMPADEDGDNVYSITVMANAAEQDVEVTVTDVDELARLASRRTLSAG